MPDKGLSPMRKSPIFLRTSASVPNLKASLVKRLARALAPALAPVLAPVLALTLTLAQALLLSPAAHAQVVVPGDIFNYNQITSYEYDSQSGQVTAEITEPDFPQQCLRKEYQYDDIGNRISTTIKNCPGASGDALFTARTSTVSYAANSINKVAGQYATSQTNALGHTETLAYDNWNGKILSSTGPNGLTTQWRYDDWNRTIRQIDPDGNANTTPRL